MSKKVSGKPGAVHSVLADTAPGDLFQPYLHPVAPQVFRSQELVEILIKAQQNFSLERRERGVGYNLGIAFLPQHPLEPIGAVVLAGQAFNDPGNLIVPTSGKAHRRQQRRDHVRVSALAQIIHPGIEIDTAVEQCGPEGFEHAILLCPKHTGQSNPGP